MVDIEWNEDAVQDFEEIYNHLKKLDIIYAENFSETILDKCEFLSSFPKLGRMVSNLQNDRVREVITKQYRIIYFLKNEDCIEILAIVHTKRDLDF
jgi:plasmid stabilization system protein ParE